MVEIGFLEEDPILGPVDGGVPVHERGDPDLGRVLADFEEEIEEVSVVEGDGHMDDLDKLTEDVVVVELGAVAEDVGDDVAGA